MNLASAVNCYDQPFILRVWTPTRSSTILAFSLKVWAINYQPDGHSLEVIKQIMVYWAPAAVM